MMMVTLPEHEGNTTFSTVLMLSANPRELPNSWRPFPYLTMRSKSFTSCFLEMEDPGTSDQTSDIDVEDVDEH
jgi:hypothetical protein